MDAVWFYADQDTRVGPFDLETLRQLRAAGKLTDETTVWKQGVESGMPLGAVLSIAPASPRSARGFLASVGGRISHLAGVDEIEDVPVQSVLIEGLGDRGPIEEVFAAGTSTTTPSLSEVHAGWPRPRVWWRILIGAIATYLLLKLGITEFDNPRFYPGLIVVGSFVVPLSIVVFFFEMNTPRNVSVYQVGKMTLFGGAVALIVTMLLGEVVTGSGTGRLLPALLTGAIEETAKALSLLLVLREVRWRWQLNGLLFGAAVGAGFAGYESAGYAWEASGVFSSILWRGLLSPGGHVIWTALIGAALWQVRGTKAFDWNMLVHPIVVRRWVVAVVLHGLWDTDVFEKAPLVQYLILLLIGWYVVFAVMKRAIGEVDATKAASGGTLSPAV